MKNLSIIFYFFCICILISCGRRPKAPPIGNNMSFPGAMAALSQNKFLLLNTSANGDYSDGSIQTYIVDNNGNHSLSNVMSVPAHASEFAVSSDSKLVALSFDSSYKDTQLTFYNYSNTASPVLLSNLTLNFNTAGGKQAIKRLGVFKRPVATGDTSYYIYGSILTYRNDDGTGGNVPSRVFLVKVTSDFSSSQVLFTLSYGVGDFNSLAAKKTSLNSLVSSNEAQYTFGFDAPTYDATHDLLIAFPTGTFGGYNYSVLPDVFTYFNAAVKVTSGTTLASNISLCNNVACKIQPDFRSISMAAVYLPSFIGASMPINNSTYFVPLAWNQNGVPYAAKSNGINIVTKDPSNEDLNSFSFQSGFSSSYWANTPNNGAAAASCFATAATIVGTQYTVIGDNSLFVVKNGTNGGNDSSDNGKTGKGNEVFAISGLDILKSNIDTIIAARVSVISAGESDFDQISKYQLIDPYNSSFTALNASWIFGSSGSKNAGPLTPFMYSRTSGVDNFDSNTIIGNISVLNFGANSCQPYWIRNTNQPSLMGRDTAWLTANPVTSLSTNALKIYPNLNNDPTQPSILSFKTGSGAQTCTDVWANSNDPRIFCVNFLTSLISKYKFTKTNPVFTSY
jgi:hypothetical protein